MPWRLAKPPSRPRRRTRSGSRETLSQTKQAEAQRDLEVKKAQYLELVKRQQAQADKAYEIQGNIMQQQVRAEEVTIHQVEKEHEVKVQDAEIQRRDRELTATVLKAAEYERKRIETLAGAEKQRLIMEAEGHAAAIRTQGEAEAEIIFKKGDAEARAMNVKAEAYQQFNQAAIVDKLISNMPEIVRALAAPLANVDKTQPATRAGVVSGTHSGARRFPGHNQTRKILQTALPVFSYTYQNPTPDHPLPSPDPRATVQLGNDSYRIQVAADSLAFAHEGS